MSTETAGNPSCSTKSTSTVPAVVRRGGSGAGGVAVQRRPRVLVDLGFEGGLERAVWITRAEKIGVADHEAHFVVVGVGVENVDAVDLHPDLVVRGGQ